MKKKRSLVVDAELLDSVKEEIFHKKRSGKRRGQNMNFHEKLNEVVERKFPCFIELKFGDVARRMFAKGEESSRPNSGEKESLFMSLGFAENSS